MKPDDLNKIAEQITGEIKQSHREPFKIGDKEYKGDIFYGTISLKAKKYCENNIPDKPQFQTDLYLKVCNKLKGAGFLIHS